MPKGRVIYDNLRKFIKFSIGGTLGKTLTGVYMRKRRNQAVCHCPVRLGCGIKITRQPLFTAAINSFFAETAFMMTNKALMTGQKDIQNESLGEKLKRIVHEIPEGNITLLEILEIFKDDGLLLLSVFLALIFLVPVSIPGVSTVFGTAILLIGIARLFQRHLWLPEKIARRTISAEKLAAGLKRALPWFHRFEKISQPNRLSWLTGNVPGLTNKLAYILAALLLMAPFGFVPFSNTLPALALIFFAVGEIEKDGGSILIGYLFTSATVIYFSVLIAGGSLTIWEGWQRLPL